MAINTNIRRDRRVWDAATSASPRETLWV